MTIVVSITTTPSRTVISFGYSSPRRQRSYNNYQQSFMKKSSFIVNKNNKQQESILSYESSIYLNQRYNNYNTKSIMTQQRAGDMNLLALLDNNNNNNNDHSDEMIVYNKNDNYTIPIDLQPPIYNLQKESLLFDSTSATLYNNNMARFWMLCQRYLPRIVHGKRKKGKQQQKNKSQSMNQAYYSTTTTSAQNTNSKNQQQMTENDNNDDHPIAYLYNMFFVRIPIIITGLFYMYQLLYERHPFICDLGDGPFEVPAIIVLGVLYILLL